MDYEVLPMSFPVGVPACLDSMRDTTGRLPDDTRDDTSPIDMLTLTGAYAHCTAVFGTGALRYDRWYR